MLQRPNCQIDATRTVRHIAEILDQFRSRDFVVLQKTLQSFARTLGIAGDQHLPRFTLRCNMSSQGTEKTNRFLLSLR